MKRFTVLATSLVVAGSALLPTAAAASPWVTATTDGVPVDGTTGHPGLPMRIEFTGCDNTGGTAVMGLFVSPAGDPWERPVEEELIQIEHAVDAEGGYLWDLVIAEENDRGTFTNRWYCATEPVTAMRDAAVTWVSPPAYMVIEDGGPIAGRSAATTKTASKGSGMSAAPSAGLRTLKPTAPVLSTVRITMDPDALPPVDKIDILGSVAARIKVEVDATAQKRGNLNRGFGRKHEGHTPTSAEYVSATYRTITGRTPSAKVMAPYVARLDAGELKVHVIEDIALTQHAAAWWNQR